MIEELDSVVRHQLQRIQIGFELSAIGAKTIQYSSSIMVVCFLSYGHD